MSDDPDMQGFTEIVSFDLRITWTRGSDATEPLILVGSTPYNVEWFDPQEGGDFKSGVAYVVSTCKRPADTSNATVQISPNGTPLRVYFFYFK